MNTILTDLDRKKFEPVIKEMTLLCPDIMARKIPRANVQQAFVLAFAGSVMNKDSKILSVGSHEDTASQSFVRMKHSIVEIDPVINVSLDDYFKNTKEKFDVIISTSVIEHVQDDELFIDQICKLLNVGGYAILTCDYNNSYVPGYAKPIEDFRLYTKHDLLGRLLSIVIKNNCELYGDINYDFPPDFEYGGCKYSFATYVFKKRS